jgi:hypothetical protein
MCTGTRIVRAWNQAEVALLDEIQQRETAPDVLLRNGNDEPQVGLDQAFPRPIGLAAGSLQKDPLIERHRIGIVGEALVRSHARLHLHRQLDLLLGGQQRVATDLLEVHPHRVGDVHQLVAGEGGGRQRILGVLTDGDLLVAERQEDIIE